jgi:hypothetical protein
LREQRYDTAGVFATDIRYIHLPPKQPELKIVSGNHVCREPILTLGAKKGFYLLAIMSISSWSRCLQLLRPQRAKGPSTGLNEKGLPDGSPFFMVMQKKQERITFLLGH